MANKLYEESAVADIAAAIRETNGKTDTYTVAQMGDAVRANRRVYTGELTETIVGTGAYLALAKSDILAQHRNDENLFVRVEFDAEAAPYTIIGCWGTNRVNILPFVSNYIYQLSKRYDQSGFFASGNVAVPVNGESASGGVGTIGITEDGELRIYSNSSVNYALRPGKWTAVVEW